MALLEKPRNSVEVPTLTPHVGMKVADSSFIFDVVADDKGGKLRYRSIPLLQVCFGCQQFVCRPLGTIGVRQRNACSFLNYYEIDGGSFSFRNFSTVKSAEYPFVAIDNGHCAEFCTINANRTVQFWRPADST